MGRKTLKTGFHSSYTPRFHEYWMGVIETGEIVAAGSEVNDLVRINDRWLISLRDVEPEDLC